MHIDEVAVLSGHSDEVWNLAWSNDGSRLATASKDNTARIWNTQPYSYIASLTGHTTPVSQLAWSPDDTLLLTVSESSIMIWDTQVQTDSCLKELKGHTDVVTRVLWLPNGTGFLSGGMDRKLILWGADGEIRDSWTSSLHITDLVINLDATRLFAHGRRHDLYHPATYRLLIVSYDLMTKEEEKMIQFESAEDCTGFELSQDSKYLLVNCYIRPEQEQESFAEIVLFDTLTKTVVQRFTGHTQSTVIIRFCFVGANEQFVASGSQDGNVCVWDRHSGALLNVLAGHGTQCVSAVACNPAKKNIFASCSDDKTVRVWQLK